MNAALISFVIFFRCAVRPQKTRCQLLEYAEMERQELHRRRLAEQAKRYVCQWQGFSFNPLKCSPFSNNIVQMTFYDNFIVPNLPLVSNMIFHATFYVLFFFAIFLSWTPLSHMGVIF